MIGYESNYFEIVEEIMTYGAPTKSNNGNYNIFSVDLKINMLEEGFPLLKTYEQDIKDIIVDTIGNVKGINNNKWFRSNGCMRYLRYGIPFDAIKQIQKEDHELVDEYCSNKGEFAPTSEEYLDRYKQLKALSSKEGLALIDKSDITFWKDITLKQRGDLGITRGVLWRGYPTNGTKKIDQLKNAYEHLKTKETNNTFIVYSHCPFLNPSNKLSVMDNIAAGNMGGLTSHISHQYYTFPISTLNRVEIYNANFKNKIKVCSSNMKEVDKQLDKYNIPKYYLDISFQQANWDFLKDAPVDIAGYGVLLTMMAKMLNMIPRNVEGRGTNVFINKVHLNVVTELFNRVSKNGISKQRVKLELDLRPEVEFIDQIIFGDFILKGYNPQPSIKIPLVKIF